MQTKIYFDGSCLLCAREMEHYRKKDIAKKFRFIDISAPDFNAADEHLDPKRIMQVMHVKSSDGKLHLGVDAFLEIWKQLPGYKKMVPIAQCYGIKQLLLLGYAIFARFRPYLPKKSRLCSMGTCGKNRIL